MSPRTCGAGCLTPVALFFGWTAVSALLNIGFMPALILFFIAALPAWGAWQLLQGEKRAVQDLTARREAARERALLELAARHQGQVTPSLLTMHVPGLTVADAKAMLDALAADGLCTVDSDDQGRMIYEFPVGRAPRVERELTPDEWVEAMSGPTWQSTRRRMTGRESRESADRSVSEDA